MNAEQLLAHFDRLREAPGAVPRLRRFILDLAVRGKLVAQDPRDEPAAELLKRIQTGKSKRIKSGEIRNPRELEHLDEEAAPFVLPPSWVWLRLADTGAIVGGGTPPSGDSANFTGGGKGIGWLTPADLGKHKSLFISHGARDLTEAGMSAGSATLMPEGSVLFTSRAPIGYVAIAANQISTNQGFKSVVPYLPECSRYIATYLQAFGPWIDSKATGTTFKEVSGKIVSGLPFPLPPLAEQHRIVAKVDELMALCDQLEAAQQERERRRDRLAAASLQRLNQPAAETTPETQREHARFHLQHLPRLTTRPEHIKALRQTFLNLAVRGKLVEQNSSDEPAAALLDRVFEPGRSPTVKTRKIKDDSTRYTVNSDLPPSWTKVRVGDICISIVPQRDKPLSFSGNIPWVTLPNFREGKLDLIFQEPALGLSLEEIRKYRVRIVPAGSVLMSCVGRFGLTVVTTVDCVPNQQIHAFCVRSEILNAKYLCYTILAQKGYLESQSTQTTISYLNKARCESLPVCLPPLAEQHRIVAKVDELMALCDQLEAQLTTTKTDSRRLLEAVLDAALAPA